MLRLNRLVAVIYVDMTLLPGPCLPSSGIITYIVTLPPSSSFSSSNIHGVDSIPGILEGHA